MKLFTMDTGNNVLLVPHLSLFLCRFVLSHLVKQCRRKVILQHFGEDPADGIAEQRCCDVCELTDQDDDRQSEILAVLKAVKEIPGFGETKVCSNETKVIVWHNIMICCDIH